MLSTDPLIHSREQKCLGIIRVSLGGSGVILTSMAAIKWLPRAWGDHYLFTCGSLTFAAMIIPCGIILVKGVKAIREANAAIEQLGTTIPHSIPWFLSQHCIVPLCGVRLPILNLGNPHGSNEIQERCDHHHRMGWSIAFTGWFSTLFMYLGYCMQLKDVPGATIPIWLVGITSFILTLRALWVSRILGEIFNSLSTYKSDNQFEQYLSEQRITILSPYDLPTHHRNYLLTSET